MKGGEGGKNREEMKHDGSKTLQSRGACTWCKRLRVTVICLELGFESLCGHKSAPGEHGGRPAIPDVRFRCQLGGKCYILTCVVMTRHRVNMSCKDKSYSIFRRYHNHNRTAIS